MQCPTIQETFHEKILLTPLMLAACLVSTGLVAAEKPKSAASVPVEMQQMMKTYSVGYNYGESPIGPEDVNMNLGSTAIVEHHLSFGLTRKFSDKVSGSFAYTHAFGNDLTSNVAGQPANTIEIEQNQYNLNVSYLF
jgi:hypothetical protein